MLDLQDVQFYLLHKIAACCQALCTFLMEEHEPHHLASYTLEGLFTAMGGFEHLFEEMERGYLVSPSYVISESLSLHIVVGFNGSNLVEAANLLLVELITWQELIEDKMDVLLKEYSEKNCSCLHTCYELFERFKLGEDVKHYLEDLSINHIRPLLDIF